MFDRIAAVLGLDDFDKRHKVAFVLLIVAMIAIVTLWIVQLKRNITSPLYANLTQGNALQDSNGQVGADEAALRAKDTDSDGLNDWDELNLYKTSPYLADSDSDTFSDKQEIESGNDPNCPQGKTCTAETTQQPAASADTTNPALSDLLNSNISGTPATVTATTAPSTTSTALSQAEKDALKQALGDTTNPTTLRKNLLQAGMDKSVLDSLSDEQLIVVVNGMIQ